MTDAPWPPHPRSSPPSPPSPVPSGSSPAETSPAEPSASAPSRRERLKAEQQRATAKIESTRRRLESARPRSPIIDAGFRAFERDVAAGGGVLAGALAFRVFLFMVPYVFVFITAFGVGAGAADKDPGTLARNAGIGGLVAKAVGSTGDLSTASRLAALVVAAFALVLATRALVKVLRIVHALIWRTRAGKTPNATRAALVLIGLVTGAMVVSALVGKLRGHSFVLGLLATLLFIAVPFGVWLFVSTYLPHPDQLPLSALVPGAAFFGLGVEGLNVITVYWIAHLVESKTDTYGAIGFALALLLWAYIFGRLITSAAVINETLWSRSRERETPAEGVDQR